MHPIVIEMQAKFLVEQRRCEAAAWRAARAGRAARAARHDQASGRRVSRHRPTARVAAGA